MRIALVILALLAGATAAVAQAQGCHTYVINGRMVTCCTTGTFTNCF